VTGDITVAVPLYVPGGPIRVVAGDLLVTLCQIDFAGPVDVALKFLHTTEQ
jgi:hypothetical protein